jgi:uncharacterized membrane protein YidH (DUF202 family)
MLRALLLIVALLIIAAIVALATGMVDFQKTQNAQAPRFEMKVNDVDVGTAPANVQVPTVGTTTRQIEVPRVTIGRDEPQPQPAPIANAQ